MDVDVERVRKVPFGRGGRRDREKEGVWRGEDDRRRRMGVDIDVVVDAMFGARRVVGWSLRFRSAERRGTGGLPSIAACALKMCCGGDGW